MKKQEWYWILLILGLLLIGYNAGGTVTLGLGNGIYFTGGLGAVLILFTAYIILNDRRKRGKDS
jgi:hypothetical protein